MTSSQSAMVKGSVNAVRILRAWVFAFAIIVSLPLHGQQPAKITPEPDLLEQHFQAAQTFQLAGDLSHASEEYRKAISVGLQRLGNLRSSESKYSEAIDLLTKSSQLDPGNTDADIDLAVTHFYTGEFPKARSLVEPVLSREPSNFRALNLMGKIEFMQGNFQAAADRLQAALAIKPDFDVAYSLALA